MATPSVTITPVLQIGSVDLGFTVSNAPNSTITKLTTITNENTQATKMVETDHSIVDSSGQPVSTVVLNSTLAPAGKRVFVTLIVTYADKTVITSSAVALTAIDIPKSPASLTTGSTVIFTEDDGGISMTIGSLYSLMSSSDGFSPITSAIVYLSKVGGTVDADFMRETVAINNGYGAKYTVKTGLSNGTVYEVAFRVVNALGQSALSDTYYLTPRDFPAILTNIKVYTLLGNQNRLSQPLNDTRGDVVLYFSKPSDDAALKLTAPVLKYVVTETAASGAANTYTLNVDASGNPVLAGLAANLSFVLASDFSPTYDYKFTIQGSQSRLGVTYTYKVIANNINGNSPDSDITLANTTIIPFTLPAPQTSTDCQLLHTTVPGSTVNGGQPYSVHTGKMTILITAISNANSGIDIKNGPNYIYKFRVSAVSTPTSYIYNDQVTFQQDPSGNYVLDFDTVPVNGTSLNDALVKGTKYIFAVIRLTQNPNTDSIILESSALSVERTVFSSPGKIRFCEAYSYNDDLTPVRSGSSAALRILFGRLTADDMSGLTTAVTGTDSSGNKIAIRYLAFQNSQPVFLDASGNRVSSGGTQLSVSHYPESADPYVFTVPVASLGTSTENYIRVQVWNNELNTYINAVESSPAFTEQALSYVSSPTDLVVTKLSESSIRVTYNQQDNTLLNGNSSANVTNRVILVADADATKVYETPVAHSVATPFVDYPNLVTGSLYRVYVIAETYYNRREYNSITRDAGGNIVTDASGNSIPDSSSKRFENVIIRDSVLSVASAAVEITGIPTVPSNLEFFASDKSITAYYDAPLNTYGVTNLYYHMYAYLSSIAYPSVPVSIANVSGTTSLTITNAINSALASATAIVNNSKYFVALRAIGDVGNKTIINEAYVHQYTAGKVRNVEVLNELSLTNATTSIPSSTVSGLLSTPFAVVPGAEVPTPAEVSVTSQSGKLVVAFRKETINVTDVVITINESDSVDALNNPVQTFDTRNARVTDINGNVTFTGLWATENGMSSASYLSAYSFEKRTVGTTDFYLVTFTGLKTAVSYNFNVMYCKNTQGTDTFSKGTVVTGSAESAPSVIRDPKFSVGDGQIITSWTIPESTGKGGATLYYTVTVTAETGSSQSFDTINTNYTVSGLENYANYVVTVGAYYIKSVEDPTKVYGDYTSVNVVSGGKIKPRPAPVGATLSLTSGDNILTYTIVPPSSIDERGDYPITALNLYIRYSGVAGSKTLVRTINNTTYASASSSSLTGTITDFTSIISGAFTHVKPLNAFAYDFILEYTPNYTDAQNIPGTTASVTPSGPVKITSTSVSGSNLNVVVNLNGSGTISNIIGLAKSNTTAIVVQNLSAGTLPTITRSGNIDNTTNYVAANQLASFALNYSSLSSINDHLTAVVTANSADTAVGSSGTQFFS